MMTSRLRAALIAALVIALAACGGGTRPAPAGDSPAAQAPAAEPTAVPEPTVAPEPTAAPQEEERSLDELGKGLEGLASFRLVFTATFEGAEAGAAKQGSLEYTQEYIAASGDQRFRIASKGDWAQSGSASGGIFEILRVGGMSYMYNPEQTGDQQCVAFSAEGQDQGPVLDAFKPEAIIGGIENARLVGRGETVNGVKTDHYAVSEGGIGLVGASSAKGDAWIASEGGYLVKYQGTATGKGMFLGPDAEGSFTWAYDLTEVDQLEAIELPEVCAAQQPSGDIPIPDGATEKSTFGTMQTFKTADAPEAVAEFYAGELGALGWTEGERTAAEGMVMMQFTKDARKLSITISKDEGGSTVMINEEGGA